MELGVGVGGDEPTVGGADDQAIGDGRVGEGEPVGLAVSEAEEGGGGAGGGEGGVEGEHEPGGLWRGRAAEVGAGGGAPRGADGGEADSVCNGEAFEDGAEELHREVGPSIHGPAESKQKTTRGSR